MTEPNENPFLSIAAMQRHAGVSADDRQALRAVYAAHVNAVGRIEAAMAAGEVCEILGVAHCNRAVRAVQRAVRGQMPVAEAALEVVQAEFEAFGKAALQEEDRGIPPALYWPDAVREPRSQPVSAPDAP